MENNRTHIVHDRIDDRTVGYRIIDNGDNYVHAVVAETRCHPNDNFNKATARAHVNSRLDSYETGARSPSLRAFDADVSMPRPTNAGEWRELEQTLLELADLRLPTPAALEQ